MKVEVAPLFYMHKNPPLKKVLHLILATLSSAILEFLVPKGTMSLLKNTTMIFLTATRSLAMKGVTTLTGVIDPDYQEEIGLFPYRREGRTMSEIQRIL